MPTFTITTEETVVGKYLVDAASKEEAEAKIANRPMDWTGVEQTDYSAFSVEVKEITE